MTPVSIREKLDQVPEPWRPKIVAEMNGHEIRVVKVKGEFVFHRHVDADELFLVVSGRLAIDTPDGSVELGPGELFVVPRDVEHRTRSEAGAEVVTIAKAGERNTGDVEHATLTAPGGQKI
jgi:mannose-6-phosphate isomerase-like protein (cupin superfamily)